ncbi:MAG: hypothetical protein R2876_05625 [Eubacteriales bacterium]
MEPNEFLNEDEKLRDRNKAKLFKTILIIIAVVFLAILAIDLIPKAGSDLSAVNSFEDSFDKFDQNNFISINSLTGDSADIPQIIDGSLCLLTDNSGKAPVVLSRPVKLDGEIYFKRTCMISLDKGYAGYLKIIWVKDSTDENYTFLSMVEYNDYGEDLMGKSGYFTLLDKDQKSIATVPFIKDEKFTEEINYESKTGKLTYTINGQSYDLDAPSLSGGYVFVIMQTVSGISSGNFSVDEILISNGVS